MLDVSLADAKILVESGYISQDEYFEYASMKAVAIKEAVAAQREAAQTEPSVQLK